MSNFGTLRYYQAQSSYVYGVHLMQDRNEVAISPGSGGQIEFWCIKKNTRLRSISVSNFIWAMARMSKNFLVCGTGNYKVHVINIKKNLIERTLSGHTAAIYGVKAIDKTFFATCSTDKTCRIWNFKKRELSQTLTFSTGILSCAYLPRSKLLVIGGYGRTLEVYKKKGKNFVSSKSCPLNTSNVWSMDTLKHKGKELIAFGHSKGFQVWNVKKRQMIHTVNDVHTSIVYGLRAVPGTNLIITGGQDYHVSVYDFKKKKSLHKVRTSSYCYNVEVDKKGVAYVANYAKKLCYFQTPFRPKVRYDDDEESDEEDMSDMSDEESDSDNTLTMSLFSVESDSDDDEEGSGRKKKKNRAQEDFTRRFEYLVSGDMTDVEISFANTTMDFFKTFLGNSSKFSEFEDEDEIKIDEKVNVSLEDSVKLLFGHKNLKIPDEKLFDYYMFFKELGLSSRAYLICRMVARVKKIGVLLFLYKRCHEKYEKGKSAKKAEKRKKTAEKKKEKVVEEDDGINDYLKLDEENIDESSEEEEELFLKKNSSRKFKSGFCLTIMNQFKDREDDILDKKKVYRIFQKEGLLMEIKEHVVKSVRKHPEFKITPKSFKQAFKYDMIELFKTKKCCNITLKSKDGKVFKAHKEVLLLSFNFFQKMMEFSGIESQMVESAGEIVLEFLNSTLVEELLNFVYLGKVKTNDLNILFQLLNHAAMYFEKDFRKVIVKKIRKVSTHEINKITIYKFLRKYISVIQNNEVLKLIPFWSSVSDTSNNKLYRYMDKIKSDEKIKMLQKRLLSLENVGKIIGDKMNSFEKKLKILQELYKQ